MTHRNWRPDQVEVSERIVEPDALHDANKNPSRYVDGVMMIAHNKTWPDDRLWEALRR